MKRSNIIQDFNKTEGKKVRVLFVCLGNICRSPAAEGIMKQLVEENDLQDFIEVDSAGTSGWHEGDLPDERMRAHGENRDYDFNSRARQFRKEDLEKFDHIIVMDRSNFNQVKSLTSNIEQLKKISMMTDYSQRYRHDHVPDPYYGGASGFELVLDLLEDATKGLLQAIKEKHAIG